MRSLYKNSALFATMILVASIPSAFATTTSYTTYANCPTNTVSTLDLASCNTSGSGKVYSNPDGTSIGNAKLWMYNALSITAPDTATLSGLSASIQNGQLALNGGGTHADANIEAWISDPHCSVSYLCALSGVYSPLYTKTITSGSFQIPTGTVTGPNRNYGISTTATYDIVGYMETNASPASSTQSSAYLFQNTGWGVTTFKITITY